MSKSYSIFPQILHWKEKEFQNNEMGIKRGNGSNMAIQLLSIFKATLIHLKGYNKLS